MVKKTTTTPENPLLSKNIPPPPALGHDARTVEDGAIIAAENSSNLLREDESNRVTDDNINIATEDNGNSVKVDTAIRATGDKRKRGKEQAVMPLLSSEEQENATVELSLYLRPSQDDKLDDLRRAYKRRTRKKLSANEVIRRLIDKATLEDIL